jgi:hypothetical protein
VLTSNSYAAFSDSDSISRFTRSADRWPRGPVDWSPKVGQPRPYTVGGNKSVQTPAWVVWAVPHDKPARLQGAAFDEAYMDHMVKAHRQAVALFQHEGKTGADPEVRAWALKTLPNFRLMPNWRPRSMPQSAQRQVRRRPSSDDVRGGGDPEAVNVRIDGVPLGGTGAIAATRLT